MRKRGPALIAAGTPPAPAMTAKSRGVAQRAHEHFTHGGERVAWWQRRGRPDLEDVCGACHPQQAGGPRG